MLKLSFILEFLKDLFFDSPEEAKFSSPTFNTRKVTILVLVIFLIAWCSFLANRVYHLAKRISEQEEALKICRTTPSLGSENNLIDFLEPPVPPVVIPYRYGTTSTCVAQEPTRPKKKH